MRWIAYALLALGSLMLSGSALALDQWKAHGTTWSNGCNGSESMCFMTIDYRHDQRPTGIFEKIGECARDRACKKALEGAMQLAGVPAEGAQIATEVIGFASSFMRQEGETVRSRFKVPNGYVLCNVRWKVWSKTTQTSMGMRMRRAHIDVSSYARKNNIGGGGEWIKAFIELRAARRDVIGRQRERGRCMEAGMFGASFLLWDQKARPYDMSGNALSSPVYDRR